MSRAEGESNLKNNLTNKSIIKKPLRLNSLSCFRISLAGMLVKR